MCDAMPSGDEHIEHPLGDERIEHPRLPVHAPRPASHVRDRQDSERGAGLVRDVAFARKCGLCAYAYRVLSATIETDRIAAAALALKAASRYEANPRAGRSGADGRESPSHLLDAPAHMGTRRVPAKRHGPAVAFGDERIEHPWASGTNVSSTPAQKLCPRTLATTAHASVGDRSRHA